MGFTERGMFNAKTPRCRGTEVYKCRDAGADAGTNKVETLEEEL
jgi:hypothetical protein